VAEVVVSDEFKGWYEDLSLEEQESVFRDVTLLEGRGVSQGEGVGSWPSIASRT